MRMMLKTVLAAQLPVVPTFSLAASETKDTDDSEIRVGDIMPCSCPLTKFSSIGKTESAYFDMINDCGGINGRKVVKFISRDDGSNPRTALDETRRLVDDDNVVLIFGSFGTPGNSAVRSYLNENKIPQLFAASGDEEWNKPAAFPWTMGWQPSFRTEGRIYANFVQAFYPDRKLAVLWQNDQFVRDFKCNLKRIADYPALWRFTRDIYNLPGIAQTVNLGHIRRHYYESHTTINPPGVVPLGPSIDFASPSARPD
jgi:branched-chain amino acid transport system substrate-binding protein